MPHRTGPSPGNHKTWVEHLLAPLPVKWTGNVSCHVQIHRGRSFGVGAFVDDQRTATAYAWEQSLPMDRTSAVKALAEDFCDYMEDLIHKKQVAGNASNSAQHTMGTPAAVQAASQGADSHRITQLEAQLAKAQHTIQRLQANAPGQASLAPGHSTAERTATRGRTTGSRSIIARPPTSHRERSRGNTRIHPGVP